MAASKINMTNTELATFKKLLLEEQATLLATESAAKDASQTVVLDQTSVGRVSRMDAMQGQAMAIETAQRRTHRLAQIKAALKRLSEDDYGFCIDCDDAINPKRLAFDPAANRCIVCADKIQG